MGKIVVQIYEVQSPYEAEKLIQLGVDHIGSVIASQEGWRLTQIRDTINLTAGSDAKSSLIPLFSDLDAILRVIDYYTPDIVHFCEVLSIKNNILESCEDLILLQENVKKRFPKIKIMRSIPISQPEETNQIPAVEMARLLEPVSDYFLTDTFIVRESEPSVDHQPVKGFVGITGKTCDWNVAAKLVQSCRIPVILAGGMSPENVFHGIMQVRPWGVDSCTRTNAVDLEGRCIRFKKDFDKVKQFVGETRRAEKRLGQQ
jgi:phosphoribosylanthranilate isomerase